MKTEDFIKRKSINGWLFFSSDRRYQSEYFSSPEERDQAIDSYIELQKEKIKERELYLKKAKEIDE